MSRNKYIEILIDGYDTGKLSLQEMCELAMRFADEHPIRPIGNN